MSKVQELMAQMETLRHQLDDQLRLKEDLLMETESLKNVKQQIKDLKDELSKEGDTLALQSIALKQFLVTDLDTSWTKFHRSVEEDELEISTARSKDILSLVA